VERTLREAMAGQESALRLELALAVPYSRFGEESVRAVRTAEPDLIVLDLESDPVLALRLAQFLATSKPTLRYLAVGPTLPTEQLIEAMRAGASEYLVKPITAGAARDALLRMAPRLGLQAAEGQRVPGKVHTFFAAKGGAGSTTLATNFAIALHRLTEKSVLLLDLDAELGEVALLLGVEPRFTFVDMIQNFHRMDAGLLASYLERHTSGVHLLSAPFSPEHPAVVTPEQIRGVLRFLREHYDYVIVDASKSFSGPTLVAFEESDLLFLIATQDLPSLRNIQRGMAVVKRRLQRGEERIRLVVNRFAATSVITLKDVERTLDLQVYWTLSNDFEYVSESVNTGVPVALNQSSRYARDIQAMVTDVVGLGGISRPPRPSLSQALISRARQLFPPRKELAPDA